MLQHAIFLLPSRPTTAGDSVVILCDAFLAKLLKMPKQLALCLLQKDNAKRAALQIRNHMDLEPSGRNTETPLLVVQAAHFTAANEGRTVDGQYDH